MTNDVLAELILIHNHWEVIERHLVVFNWMLSFNLATSLVASAILIHLLIKYQIKK